MSHQIGHQIRYPEIFAAYVVSEIHKALEHVWCVTGYPTQQYTQRCCRATKESYIIVNMSSVTHVSALDALLKRLATGSSNY